MRKKRWGLITAVIIALVFTLLLASCNQSDPTPTATIAPTPSKIPASSPPPPATPTDTPTPEEKPKSPEELLQASFEAMADVETCHVVWHVDMFLREGVVSNAMRFDFEGEYLSPDRLQGTTSTHYGGRPVFGDGTEIISIANSSYFKVPWESEWEELTEEDFEYPAVIGGELLRPGTIMDIHHNIEYLGEETLEGTPVYHLAASISLDYFFPSLGHPDKFVTKEFWIGIDDMLIRKTLIEAADDGDSLFISGDTSLDELVVQSAYVDFGTNVVIEAPVPAQETRPEVIETAEPGETNLAGHCDGMPNSYVAYVDSEMGIAFCYPGDWLADDFVSSAGFITISPSSFTFDAVPDSLILLYPHASVSGFVGSDTSIENILYWASLFFFQIIPDAEIDGELDVVTIDGQEVATLFARGTSEGAPLLGIMQGFIRDQTMAMSISYLLDEDSYRPTTETILDSVRIELPQFNVMEEALSIEVDSFVEGMWQQTQPTQLVFNAIANNPVLLVAQTTAGVSFTDPIRLTIYDPQGGLLDDFDTGWTGDEWMDRENVHHFRFGFLPAGAMLFVPEQDGDYMISVGEIQDYNETGEFRFGIVDFQPEAALVIDHISGDIAEDSVVELDIEGLADQPLMAYVQPIGSNASASTLILQLLSNSGSILEEVQNYTLSGQPVFHWWVPREDSSYSIRISEEAGLATGYDLTVVAEKGHGRAVRDATQFVANNLDLTLHVQENGDLQVEEEITLTILDMSMEQVDIPLNPGAGIDLSTLEIWEGSIALVESESGTSGTFSIVQDEERLILRLHLGSITESALDFVIRYSAIGVVQEDSVQVRVDIETKLANTVFWQAVPAERSFDVHEAQIKIIMPYDIALHDVYGWGAESRAYAETDSLWNGITREITFSITRDLAYDKGMGIYLAFTQE